MKKNSRFVEFFDKYLGDIQTCKLSIEKFLVARDTRKLSLDKWASPFELQQRISFKDYHSAALEEFNSSMENYSLSKNNFILCWRDFLLSHNKFVSACKQKLSFETLEELESLGLEAYQFLSHQTNTPKTLVESMFVDKVNLLDEEKQKEDT